MTSVHAYDGPTAPDALLREVFALWQAEDAELRPDDPPYTREEVDGVLRLGDEREEHLHFIARDGDGRVVGRADARLPLTSNLDGALVELYVLPDDRKRGAGTALLRSLVDAAEARGRTRLRTQILEGTPAEHLERYAAVRSVLNSAPRGDLVDEDWRHTPASVATEADELEAQLLSRLTAVVRHDASGAFVGFTEVIVTDSAPAHAWQGGTAVDPAHRGRGLGHWLKGAMVERLLAERPALRFVDTENVHTNEPMLAINTAMGFAPMHTLNDWQAPFAAIRTALEASR